MERRSAEGSKANDDYAGEISRKVGKKRKRDELTRSWTKFGTPSKFLQNYD